MKWQDFKPKSCRKALWKIDGGCPTLSIKFKECPFMHVWSVPILCFVKLENNGIWKTLLSDLTYNTLWIDYIASNIGKRQKITYNFDFSGTLLQLWVWYKLF